MLEQNPHTSGISALALTDELTAVEALLKRVEPILAADASIRKRAAGFIKNQRAKGAGGTVESFLQSYGLSTKEGIALLCLAEALLRIPDATTADALIEDTFASGNWKQHLGNSDSTLVNASTWALMLTGSVLNMGDGESLTSWFGNLIKKSGEPVIRNALRGGMKFLGSQFVMGENIGDAIGNAKGEESKGYSMSYDILGEGARTDAQAQGYIDAYMAAIQKIAAGTGGELFDRPGISVKLSALHPRYSALQEDRVETELLPRLKSILHEAKKHGIAVSLDAEEANRLDLQLAIYHHLLNDPAFDGFDGIGFVLQAYGKRAVHIAEALGTMARDAKRRIPVRLVKGAYWDSEIKYAQVMGLPGYPVFTRKTYTDVSYLACAQALLKFPDHIYPQFATHNALTAATIVELAGKQKFEFQRLHGMGMSLHDQLVKEHRCRIYAPVGEHKDLLAYLIRRLLENGANTSFVHLLLDQATPIEALTQSPIAEAKAFGCSPNPLIALPRDMYGPTRTNSKGYEFGYRAMREAVVADVAPHLKKLPAAPARAEEAELKTFADKACAAYPAWEKLGAPARAAILRNAADLMEHDMARFMAICIAEGKKTYNDAVAEVREAVDFLRYYADVAEQLFAPKTLPGPTGESNVLTLHGRGMFLCISPWNFPLAIFTGQVAAALVAGNAVIAKPADQTPRIAAAAVECLHKAGVPRDVLQLAYSSGRVVGQVLVAHPKTAGICFTGSTAVAKTIQKTLAEKEGPIVPFIAETGGQNVMIVDSSALLEQAVDDILLSAFGSAGQRCSALRALFVQEDIAPALKDLLQGAMAELRVGISSDLRTDVSPVIDANAQKELQTHIEETTKIARWHATAPAAQGEGTFVAPTAFGLDDLSQLTEEHFGPVLHVFTYKANELPQVIEKIHATGYGLTFGLQTRLRSTMDAVLNHVHAGNRYVNRSMIGAVVGVQPFGGEGLSGTGPKAGGPYYLLRFAHERTTTINTAAIGGNIELLA